MFRHACFGVTPPEICKVTIAADALQNMPKWNNGHTQMSACLLALRSRLQCGVCTIQAVRDGPIGRGRWQLRRRRCEYGHCRHLRLAVDVCVKVLRDEVVQAQHYCAEGQNNLHLIGFRT